MKALLVHTQQSQFRFAKGHRLQSCRPEQSKYSALAAGFSTRPSVEIAQDNWSIPANINQDNLDKCVQLGTDPCPAVNASLTDGAPALSWDGQTLVFYSNRGGGSGGNDLCMSTRTKLNTPQ